jgi:hypothetical protein
MEFGTRWAHAAPPRFAPGGNHLTDAATICLCRRFGSSSQTRAHTKNAPFTRSSISVVRSISSAKAF